MAEPPRVAVEDAPTAAIQGAAGETAAPSAGEAGVLGTRAHVRHSLERLRAVLAEARRGEAWWGPAFAFGGARGAAGASAWRAPPPVRAQLRESVRAYACRLRADGVPPERMLVLVKTAIREAIPPELDAFEAPALTGALVRESIMAFYEVPSPT